MLVRVGKDFFDVPEESLLAMTRAYDQRKSLLIGLTSDRGEFMRVTEAVALAQAGADGAAAAARGEKMDDQREQRYKRVLRSVLRRRSNKKKGS